MASPLILINGGASISESLIEKLRTRGIVKIQKELRGVALLDAQRQAEILVVSGGTKLPAEVMKKMPNLKMIADFGVGYDGIDIEEAIRRNIFVSHTPNVLNDDVADTAMCLLLNCMRQMIEAQKFIERGEWEAGNYPLTSSATGIRLGLAGYGRIGAEIAARAQGFKMKIGYLAHKQKPEVPHQYFSSIIDLAKWADVLLIAMPATPETYHIVNSKVLEALGRHGYLVNIARGSLVDTQALITALQSAQIAGAGLDVFEQEPHVPADLMNLPNVVLTPHVGSATVNTRQKMADLVLANIDAYLAGRSLITKVPGTRD